MTDPLSAAGGSLDQMVVSIRADTSGFARDVAAMTDSLTGPLVAGADKASRSIETSLARALETGKSGFVTLRTVALTALADIAAGAVKAGLDSLLGGSGSTLSGTLGSALGGLLGTPGRAIGGPVAPGVPYLVGERGPELFVPTAAGRIDPGGAGGGQAVNVAITINAASDAPQALAQSSRQIARAVKAALGT